MILCGMVKVVSLQIHVAPSTLLHGSTSMQLPQPTSDDIEMRVCADQDRDDEDIRIKGIHIFVQ